jgi:hypothetical protein
MPIHAGLSQPSGVNWTTIVPSSSKPRPAASPRRAPRAARQRVIEQRVARLQRGAAREVQPEEAGEREFLRPAFLVDGALAGQVEGALHVGQRLPLGRRVLVAGQVPAALGNRPR